MAKAKNQPNPYWTRIAGIDLYKLDWHFKRLLYQLFNITLPKLKNQRDYWKDRGRVYMEEILASGYLDREVFFQDLLVDGLRKLDFDSAFESGCGFGWNVRRIKEVFSHARVGGIDFSASQLDNALDYLAGQDIQIANGDICAMPFSDNAFDVGFSLGVFMNIPPEKIDAALREMIRVCGKFIIHIEYDENHTTRKLRDKRAFKTNIISHDYRKLYEAMGKRVRAFQTYKDFGQAYAEHKATVKTPLDRWEGFEGPEKYIFIVVEV